MTKLDYQFGIALVLFVIGGFLLNTSVELFRNFNDASKHSALSILFRFFISIIMIVLSSIWIFRILNIEEL